MLQLTFTHVVTNSLIVWLVCYALFSVFRFRDWESLYITLYCLQIHFLHQLEKCPHLFSLNFSLYVHTSSPSFIFTFLHGIRARAFINGIQYSGYSYWFIFLFSARADSNGISTKPFFLHHGKTPGEILVTQPLTEDNYPM